MKVKIGRDRDRDRDRDGWTFSGEGLTSACSSTYAGAVRAATAAGHEIDNAGWLRRMLMWNFNNHALDGYPGWEIEIDRSPAFVKLTHVRNADGSGVESHKLAAAWDDVAAVDFYQRDWIDDGIPFVTNGDTYWSGWWFASIAERDRFVVWIAARGAS